MSDYHDGKVECTPTALRIQGYYFPWGAKTIPYASIKNLSRYDMSTTRGKWRIWGTGTFRYWANLDSDRPKKLVAFVVDDGKKVKPFVTPDDPDAFETSLREHANLGPSPGSMGPAPFI
jgi:hypothetical protein